MDIDLTSPPLPRSLTLSAGIDWVSECVGEVRAKGDVDFALVSLLDGEVAKLDGGAAANAPLIRALVSALVERREDRSTIALVSDRLDPGQRTLGQLLQDREAALHEILRLRKRLGPESQGARQPRAAAEQGPLISGRPSTLHAPPSGVRCRCFLARPRRPWVIDRATRRRGSTRCTASVPCAATAAT